MECVKIAATSPGVSSVVDVRSRLVDVGSIVTQLDFDTYVFGNIDDIGTKLNGMSTETKRGNDVPYLVIQFGLQTALMTCLKDMGYVVQTEDYRSYRPQDFITHSSQDLVGVYHGFRYRFVPAASRFLVAIDPTLVIQVKFDINTVLEKCASLGIKSSTIAGRLVTLNEPLEGPRHSDNCFMSVKFGRVAGRVLRIIVPEDSDYGDRSQDASSGFKDCENMLRYIRDHRNIPLVLVRSRDEDKTYPSTILFPLARPEELTEIIDRYFQLKVDLSRLIRAESYLDSGRGLRADASSQRFFNFQQITSQLKLPLRLNLGKEIFELESEPVPISAGDVI